MNCRSKEESELQDLSSTLKNLPNLPGVYLYFDEEDEILYVGKSRNLKQRVSSYFDRSRKHDLKTIALVEKIARLEFVTTRTETEALILECNLIKKYSPHYNILFKDGKTYPWIKVHLQHPYPWLEKVREVKKDGAKYYGPYAQEWKVNRILKFVDRHYKLVKCNKPILDRSGKACLDYQIGRCDGPCFQEIEEELYKSELEEVLKILDGKLHLVIARLDREMQRASRDLEFELAARYRDQMKALELLREQQDATVANEHSYDVLGISVIGNESLIQHIQIRSGKISDQSKVRGEVNGSEPEELLVEYMKQLSLYVSDPPREFIFTEELEETEEVELFKQAYQEKFTRQIILTTPIQGRKRRLALMASKNAFESLKVELAKEERSGSLLLSLKEELELEKVPYRIECFDISNIQGTNPVASMVVAMHGKMEKREYRKFKIRIKETPDDFAMMREAVYRRYSRLQKEGSAMPDLVLIDGGLGQLSSAAAALQELGLKLQLCSLAKREELVFIEGRDEPVQLGKGNPTRLFLQEIRDEAHRFAVSYHRTLRSKRTLHSILEEVEGIGPKRRAKILKTYPDYKSYSKLSVEDLMELGVPRQSASDVLKVVKAALLVGQL